MNTKNKLPFNKIHKITLNVINFPTGLFHLKLLHITQVIHNCLTWYTTRNYCATFIVTLCTKYSYIANYIYLCLFLYEYIDFFYRIDHGHTLFTFKPFVINDGFCSSRALSFSRFITRSFTRRMKLATATINKTMTMIPAIAAPESGATVVRTATILASLSTSEQHV